MVIQVRGISKETYLSMSDETKLRMAKHKFFVDKEEWKEIIYWVRSNLTGVYYIENSNNSKSRWISFYDEEDATGFKLKWL